MATRRTYIGFAIGVAAERTGMHPQTIRDYERRGLITPQRTQGGARRYSHEEVERLLRIQQLTTEHAMSLAGVELVLKLEQENHDLMAALKNVVTRLRVHEPNAMVVGFPQTAQQQRESQEKLPVRRSVSVELVHVPRTPRSPRWKNR